MKCNKKYADGGKVDYSTPYKGAMGKSADRETAKKKWMANASPTEMKLGMAPLKQDADGNYIVRTKLSSKANRTVGDYKDNAPKVEKLPGRSGLVIPTKRFRIPRPKRL